MDSKRKIFSFNDVDFLVDLPSNEQIISNQLDETSSWEEHQLRIYDILFHNMREPFAVIDIGANVGINSIYIKKRFPLSNVFSVEAHPSNYALLRQNIVNANVSINSYSLAISDSNGSINFTSDAGTNAHIVPSPQQGFRLIEVSCLTLNDFVSQIGCKSIELLKIDVEGYTDLVLNQGCNALDLACSCIVEFSHGDIANRYGFALDSGSRHPNPDVVIKASAEIRFLQNHFSHLYLITRTSQLVELRNPDDLFFCMFLESSVGDVLATDINGLPSIEFTTYLAMRVAELQYQNGCRIQDVISLRGKCS